MSAINDILDAKHHNQQVYQRNSASLQRKLAAIHKSMGLGAALQSLVRQQMDSGFIGDDLSEVSKYRIVDLDDKSRYFTVQYNPRRANRLQGAGRRVPPRGWLSVNDGCFLCFDNVVWQQRSLEIGFRLTLAGTEHIAWPNPFPFLPNHFTIATVEHTPQSLNSTRGVEKTVSEMLELAKQLPNWILMYNGAGAGASNPRHSHFQAFTRWQGSIRFPLEEMASLAKGDSGVQEVDGYPLFVLRIRGEFSEVVNWVVEIAAKWAEFCGAAASANLAATYDVADDGMFVMYFVPRDTYYSRSPGFSGVIGGLEILGEILFSTEEEKHSLDRGHVDAAYIRRILSAVEPPAISRLLAFFG